MSVDLKSLDFQSKKNTFTQVDVWNLQILTGWVPACPSWFENHWSKTSQTTSHGIVTTALKQIKYSICTPDNHLAPSVFTLKIHLITNVQSAKTASRMKSSALSISSCEISLGTVCSVVLSFFSSRGILQCYDNYEFKCIINRKHKRSNNICQFIKEVSCLSYEKDTHQNIRNLYFSDIFTLTGKEKEKDNWMVLVLTAF